jgi:hypothetical protein
MGCAVQLEKLKLRQPFEAESFPFVQYLHFMFAVEAHFCPLDESTTFN